ncbi:MAG TPA: long-chain fatty acid--CoA ligase [Abditibacteriaceae bacterium]|nr:long-chain fatty acid--CoA ligase [Abditibacteriaceae bacterium]
MFDPKQPPQTLGELAQRAFSDHASSPCLGLKNKDKAAYEYATYAQVGERVQSVACGLLELGLERGQRAAILGENRPEWALSDLACQMIGVISVPLFATLPSAQVKGILRDCGATLVFVSNASQLKKIEEIRADLPDFQTVVCFDRTEGALSFDELEKSGIEYSKSHPTEYESTWPAAQSDDIATIIYTSGTTGDPKGVMLSHRNIISNVEAVREALHEAFGNPRDEVFLSFLPLAHIYERSAGFFLPLRMGAAIAYCESLFTVDKNLREARPTLMMCVPRLYESLQEKLHEAGKKMPDVQREKYLDALRLAVKSGSARGGLENAPNLGLLEKLKLRVYDAKVYSKIRERFGGRLRAFISGGAPMSGELGALFTGVGLNILEGYGLTETSPVIAVNRPGRVRLGTVGEPVKSVEVRIESDGEICVRGASISKGYWNKPQETKESFRDGWFYTGDLGSLENGYLKITGRKKDLLVLANGKKVAPAPIEMKLETSPFISQIVLLGDKAKAVSALIVPRMEAVREHAAKEDWGLESDEALLASAELKTLFRKEIDALSNDLADFEKIRKITLLDKPFSVESGEMTPTLKIKRNVVAEKYAAEEGD